MTGNTVSNSMIKVESLSKIYNIAESTDKQLSLQQQISGALMAPVRRIQGLVGGNAYAAADLGKEFWALRDVEFEIPRGEVVAIIGRNGAGKSTLLKVLSRITKPSSGRAVINGRVGSLLEVGTGFHPELTGRENVYLNASIIGMRKAEVDAKFDEIVDFSEVGDFVDTPVKHYSSGMRVRLAFAVAAHLEPEVLFVDEVLAVGDAAFRRKCMDKVRQIGENGATVMVVSHNAQAVASMCSRALWLNHGELVADGPIGPTIAEYLAQSIGVEGERIWGPEEPAGADVVRVRAIRIRDHRGGLSNNIDVRDRFCIETEFEVLKSGHSIVVKNDLYTSEGTGVLSAVDTNNPSLKGEIWEPGIHTTRMWIPGNFLQLETYLVGLAIWTWSPDRGPQFGIRDAVSVHIINGREEPDATGGFSGTFSGPIRPILEWETQQGSFEGTAALADRRTGT